MPAVHLRWFPGASPGKCSPAQMRARIVERQRLFHEAQRNSVSRAPLTNPDREWPKAVVAPVARKTPPKGRGVVSPERVLRPDQFYRPRAGLDVGGDIAAMIDALYDNAVIANPDVMALGAVPRGVIVTPGTPVLAADNTGGWKPLYVRLKGEVDPNGLRTFLYASQNNGSMAAGSAVAKYDFGPSIDLILNSAGQVFVDGTAPAGQSTFTVQVTTFFLNGRNTFFPGG